MSVKDFWFGKRISGFINLINILLAVISIIIYSVKAAPLKEFSTAVVVYLVFAIVCCAVYAVADFRVADILNLAAAVFMTIALAKLIIDSINIFADGLNGITMFGTSGEIGHIVKAAVIMAVMLIAEIISCFMSRDRKDSGIKIEIVEEDA